MTDENFKMLMFMIFFLVLVVVLGYCFMNKDSSDDDSGCGCGRKDCDCGHGGGCGCGKKDCDCGHGGGGGCGHEGGGASLSLPGFQVYGFETFKKREKFGPKNKPVAKRGKKEKFIREAGTEIISDGDSCSEFPDDHQCEAATEECNVYGIDVAVFPEVCQKEGEIRPNDCAEILPESGAGQSLVLSMCDSGPDSEAPFPHPPGMAYACDAGGCTGGNDLVGASDASFVQGSGTNSHVGLYVNPTGDTISFTHDDFETLYQFENRDLPNAARLYLDAGATVIYALGDVVDDNDDASVTITITPSSDPTPGDPTTNDFTIVYTFNIVGAKESIMAAAAAAGDDGVADFTFFDNWSAAYTVPIP